MKRAYLYVRVSTDEQKRKGYSLPEQEDHLLKYCEFNNIEVIGIYREDYSAKNFNRPEWRKLLTAIKKDSKRMESNILFVKWDRYSRNIEYAYEMIGILRNLKTTAMAIDQPIDFTVPESTVMLAMYLSIPEAENTRRSMNTSKGIRRAKMMGRYPGKAPLGYINLTGPDGRKRIELIQPAADIVKWAFRQLAKNSFQIETVRRMACAKGLVSSRSAFWKLVHNPVYCGLIPISLKEKPVELVKGIHEPLISEALFYEVQAIITSHRKITYESDKLNNFFMLKGLLNCPACEKKFYASFSKGSHKAYPYYHCSGGCKIRMRGDKINNSYIEKLQELRLSTGARELFRHVLKDVNISRQRTEYLGERRSLTRQREEQLSMLSKIRKLFVDDRLKFDDFSALKTEYQTICNDLDRELNANSEKLRLLEKQLEVAERSLSQIFSSFSDLDVVDKKYIVSLIPPVVSDLSTGTVSLKFNKALLSTISSKTYPVTFQAPSSNRGSKTFTEKKVSVKRVISVMAKYNIEMSDNDAAVVLDFLYCMAKTYHLNSVKKDSTLRKIRTSQKLHLNYLQDTI